MAETFEIKDGVNIGLTTAERDALTPQEGDTIYNTTDDEIQTYDGTQWNSVSGGGGGSQDLQSVLDEGSTASVATEVEIVDTSVSGWSSELNLSVNPLGFNGAGITTYDGANVYMLMSNSTTDSTQLFLYYDLSTGLNTGLSNGSNGSTLATTDPLAAKNTRIIAQTDSFATSFSDITVSVDGVSIRYGESGSDTMGIVLSDNGVRIDDFNSLSDYVSYAVDKTFMPRGFITQNGITANRPVSPVTGEQYFDTTLGYPIWYDGTNWVNASGATV